MNTDTSPAAAGSLRGVRGPAAGAAAFASGGLIGWVMLDQREMLRPVLGLVAAAALVAVLAWLKRRDTARRAAWDDRLVRVVSANPVSRGRTPRAGAFRSRPALRSHGSGMVQGTFKPRADRGSGLVEGVLVRSAAPEPRAASPRDRAD